MSLIQWLPEIARATHEDIVRFGPQAARVRALLEFISGMSNDAKIISRNYINNNRTPEWEDALRQTISASKASGLRNFRNLPAAEAELIRTFDPDFPFYKFRTVPSWLYNSEGVGGAGASALRGELYSDLIEPETYKILTDPLRAGFTYDTRLAQAGPGFIPLLKGLGPNTADDIEIIADLSLEPHARALIEIMQATNMPDFSKRGTTATTSFAERLKRLERLYKYGTPEGRRLS